MLNEHAYHRKAGRAVADQLRQAVAVGQFFELLARPNPQAEFRAYRRNRRLRPAHAHPASVARGPAALGRRRLLAGTAEVAGRRRVHRGRPVALAPADGSGPLAHRFLEMKERLELLRPPGLHYRATMQKLRHGLLIARSVEDWRPLSQARLLATRELVTHVAAWARDGVSLAGRNRSQAVPGLLLVGSSTYGLGLVSDIDFLPVWPTADGHGPAGRELVERLACGLNACDVRADNLVVRWSAQRLASLSLPGWRAELSAVEQPAALAAALLTVTRAPVIGDEDVARAFVAVVANAPWRPSPWRWRRRWVGWWAGLKSAQARTPPPHDPLAITLLEASGRPLCEMLSVAPPGRRGPTGSGSTSHVRLRETTGLVPRI